MATFDFKVRKELPADVKPETYDQALKNITSAIEAKDLIVLANKVKSNPGLVKKALAWI